MSFIAGTLRVRVACDGKLCHHQMTATPASPYGELTGEWTDGEEGWVQDFGDWCPDCRVRRDRDALRRAVRELAERSKP